MSRFIKWLSGLFGEQAKPVLKNVVSGGKVTPYEPGKENPDELFLRLATEIRDARIQRERALEEKEKAEELAKSGQAKPEKKGFRL